MISIDQADFSCIGQMAIHCDKEKLCIAIDEAINFDINPLLCDCYSDVDENWDDPYEPFNSLINGGTYEDCQEKERHHLGIKRVLVYFSYARYLMINSWNDTPNGHVTKNNPFSIPKPLKEIESFSNRYRDMAFKTWEHVKKYLCANRESFPCFDASECKCACGNGCGRSEKGFGVRGSTVTKWDV